MVWHCDADDNPDPAVKIVFTLLRNNYRVSTAIPQLWQDGGACFFQPIHDYFVDRLEKHAAKKRAKQGEEAGEGELSYKQWLQGKNRLKKQVSKCCEYIEATDRIGMPSTEEALQSVCDALRIKVVVHYPLHDLGKAPPHLAVQCKHNPEKTFTYVNSRFSHVDLSPHTRRGDSCLIDTRGEPSDSRRSRCLTLPPTLLRSLVMLVMLLLGESARSVEKARGRKRSSS